MKFQNALMKARRGALGLSLRGLERAMFAHGSEISPQALQQWETGDTTPGRIEDVAALALVLDVELNDLFQPEVPPVSAPAPAEKLA